MPTPATSTFKQIMQLSEACQNVLQSGFQRLGSANAKLKPSHCWAFGNTYHPDSGSVRVFVERQMSTDVLRDCEDTKKAALYVSLFTHEAYQIKGMVTEISPLSEAEVEQAKALGQDFMSGIERMFGQPPEVSGKLFGIVPDTGVTIQIEKVFNQTPGPNAGQPVS